MMVGITIGLIVAAAAGMVMAGQIRAHRQLTLEIQLQQELRAAADLLQNDIRRAGFWAAPEMAVWANGQPVLRNPYSTAADCSAKSGDKQLVYAYSKADYGLKPKSGRAQGPEAEGDEYFGLRLSEGKLYFMFGCTNGRPNWQPLTDAATVVVDELSIAPALQTLPLPDSCTSPCTGADCPRLQRRRFDITIRAHSAIDERVKRRLQLSSQVRNDAALGACPA
jgi:type IV pilus assembly protein PilW